MRTLILSVTFAIAAVAAGGCGNSDDKGESDTGQAEIVDAIAEDSEVPEDTTAPEAETTLPDTCEPNCELPCEPACGELECGPDPAGCGGDCGVCTSEEECVEGKCECKPKCDDRECGEDLCGGSCGSCDEPKVCDEAEGQCVCDCDDIPYSPVCDAYTLTTYDSPCLAECAGILQYDKGACPLDCEGQCTEEELAPVDLCGTDQLTYANFCDLKCAIGTDGCKDINNCPQVQFPGQCPEEACEECPNTVDPLCGVDGVTYQNKCLWLMCYPDCTPEICDPVDLLCQGECVDSEACPNCDEKCVPVCGLDGNVKKTYMNDCARECDGAKFLEDGPCCPDCPDVEEWVCGLDYKVYQSECHLLCKAPEQSPHLYEIPEEPDGTFQLAVCNLCMADLSSGTEAPLCGDDYLTYFNQAAFDCMSGLKLDLGDEPYCAVDECGFDSCPCPTATGGLPVPEEQGEPPAPGDTGERGVCGADGNTYGNKCSAVYNGSWVESNQWCPSCAETCTGLQYDPVCCPDGVTYPNLCIPDQCNDKLDSGECSKGAC